MNVNAMIAAAEIEFAKIEANKYGRKSYAVTVDGVTLTLSQTRDAWGRVKVAIQFKRDGKVVSRAKLQNEAVADVNPELLVAFEAQAPALAADYADYIRRVFASLIETYGPTIETSAAVKAAREALAEERKAASLVPRAETGRNSEEYVEAWARVRRASAAVDKIETDRGEFHRIRALLTRTDAGFSIDEMALRSAATDYGFETARQWFYKTNQKLGQLTEAVVPVDESGFVTVTGKRDGHSVTMRQQRVTKWSAGCGMFHQFPAHLYIDGKFYPEAAFSKFFK